MSVTPAPTTSQQPHISTISVLGGLWVLIAAGIYLAFRTGFDPHLQPVLINVGLGLGWVSLPSLLQAWRTWRGSPAAPVTWLGANTTVMLFGGLLLVGLGLLSRYGLNLSMPFAVIGVVGWAVVLVIWLWRVKLKGLPVLVFALVFGVWLAGATWGSDYQHPLLTESILIDADFDAVSNDSLFHTTLSQMFRTYGVFTIGVDGLPVMKYHVASHWLFSLLPDLFGIDMLVIYALSYGVLFVPVYQVFLLTAALDLRAWFYPPANQPLHRSPLFWLLFSLPQIWLVRSMVTGMAISSESYIFSMAWLLALIIMVADVLRRHNIGQTKPLLDGLTLFVLFPVGMAILGWLKISTLFIAAGVVGYVMLRSALMRRWLWVVAMLVTLGVSLLTYTFVSPDHGDAELGLFSFFWRYLTFRDLTPLFILIHYVWAWLFLAWRLKALAVNTLRQVWEVGHTNRGLDLELVAIFVLGGIGSQILFYTESSMMYFSDPHRVIALVMLCAALPSLPIPTRLLAELREPITARTRWAAVLLTVIGFAFSLSIIVNFLIMVRGLTLGNLYARNLFTTEQLSRQFDAFPFYFIPEPQYRYTFEGVDWATVADQIQNNQALIEQHPNYPMLHTLLEVNQWPLAEKEITVLYIPHTNQQYWGHLDRCYAEGFMAAALSGLTQIGGRPPAACPPQPFYGFSSLEPATLPNPGATNAQLCEAALYWGTRQVLILEAESDGEISQRLLRCINHD